MAGRKKSYRAYLVRRKTRRLISRIYRRLYRDEAPEIGRCIMLAGTGRSGTTWLAELIGLQQPTRIMFEPFHSLRVPDYSQFNHFLYMRPGDRDEELRAFCERVFTGQIRNPWIDSAIEVLRPKARIVKEIRANLLLSWINRQFPDLPLILLLRHPCAVVLSRMELGWATDEDLSYMMSQRILIDDFLEDKEDLIRDAQYDEEKHAIIWAIHNAIPLSQFKDGGLNIVKYEDLISDTPNSLRTLLGSIGWNCDESLSSLFERPSRTSSLSTALQGATVANLRWQKSLSSVQIDRIMRVVDEFGLTHLYQ